MIKLKKIINEQLKYPSDRIRLEYIKIALSEEPSDEMPIRNKLLEIDFESYDDLVFCKKRKDNSIEYYEGFVASCWESLFSKPGYEELSKKEALKKLVEERFSEIAKELNLSIDLWNYKQNVLYIKFTNR